MVTTCVVQLEKAQEDANREERRASDVSAKLTRLQAQFDNLVRHTRTLIREKSEQVCNAAHGVAAVILLLYIVL